MAISILALNALGDGPIEIPYAQERSNYLSYCASHGYAKGTLRNKRAYLRLAAHILSPDASSGITAAQLETRVRQWSSTLTQNDTGVAEQVITAARPWLQYVGWWVEPEAPIPFQEKLTCYRHWMTSERGFTNSTVDQWCRRVRTFLRWYGQAGRPLTELHPTDVDKYLAEGRTKGWRRQSVRTYVYALRSFFRFCGSLGWCSPSVANAMESPRIYQLEQLPFGPKWGDVQSLLSEIDTDRPGDVRDYAIVMLLSVYGLRAGEVTRLKLSDFDWKNERLRVQRVKSHAPQTYPLVAEVGNRIARYLHDVRPRCDRQEVFLGVRAPHRPLTQGALHALISPRLKRLGATLAHWGPHALRHACACHLLETGLPLKEIGDHLGHHSAESTRIYAKVDLPALREVAAFDIGELL